MESDNQERASRKINTVLNLSVSFAIFIHVRYKSQNHHNSKMYNESVNILPNKIRERFSLEFEPKNVERTETKR